MPSATHPGRVRTHNEDCLLARPELGVWLVADGMGGHRAGDFASRRIAESAARIGLAASAMDLKLRFLDRLAAAHDEIRRHSDELDGATVGSTLAALLVFQHHFACIWSGDSRVYLSREGVLHQLTTDHTEVNELLRQGMISAEQAAHWPRKNVITRAIGVFDAPETDETYGTLQAGDTFLLCSDGLTGHVSDEEIAIYLMMPGAQAACDRLVALTLDRGARDNVTTVVARCLVEAPDDDDERTRPRLPLVAAHDRQPED
jgi:protein phosphatase